MICESTTRQLHRDFRIRFLITVLLRIFEMGTGPAFHLGGLTFCSLYISLFILFESGVQVHSINCGHFNATHPNVSSVLCKKEENLCFALWSNISGKVEILNKGCWYRGSNDEQTTDTCVGKRTKNHTFCRCKMNMCNENIVYHGEEEIIPTTRPTNVKEQPDGLNFVFVLVPVICVTVLILILFFVYLRTRPSFKSIFVDSTMSTDAVSLLTTKEIPPIQLKDVLSTGQFCMVRKGKMGNVDVAVKIFPVTQRAKATPSALTEMDIYNSCNLNHQNILKFIATQNHEEGNQTQLWIITEYIEKGSLSDFLKRNTITWDNLCFMAEGMASGMAYLHAEILQKPSIAHRDMKSKNVLVKNDLTCCISDFGLSLKFDSKSGPGDTHGQVGTRRYMAPEVLEGAINFSREAFLRIDMYAFSLCLWEVLSRCTAVEGPVGEYKFPFEEEVGMHPSLEELQETVVMKKVRPKFREDWKQHVGIKRIIETIDECWDHDADARLTADCVAERVKQLRTINQRHTGAPLSVSLNINSDVENNALA